MTQNNLGLALWTLGERESGTQHLTEAVAAFRAALQERTRARVPLGWATTQNNLGNVLRDLGTRTHDTNQLCEALDNQINAWQVFAETPYYASWAASGVKEDVDAIHREAHETAPACLQTHLAELNRMGVEN
jgi:hypothetical protein